MFCLWLNNCLYFYAIIQVSAFSHLEDNGNEDIIGIGLV